MRLIRVRVTPPALYISFHFLDTSLKYCRGSTGLVSVCGNALEKNGEQRKEYVYAAFVPVASRICTAALVCFRTLWLHNELFSLRRTDIYVITHWTALQNVTCFPCKLPYSTFLSLARLLFSVIWHVARNDMVVTWKIKTTKITMPTIDVWYD